MIRRTSMLIGLFATVFFSHQVNVLAQAQQRCDVLLRGGEVHRGDGSPAMVADIAIKDSKIVAIGVDLPFAASVAIDCRGKVVAPGFIDLHNHSDNGILARGTRSNINFLMQGCTTIVTGNCGSGHVDVAKYLSDLEKNGAGTNVAHLLPHGSLRSDVIGKSDRAPSDEELEKMKQLAEQAMKDGAFGMSTGLIYIPGVFAKTDELIAIAKVVAKYHGIYASHIRGEGTNLLKSVEEAIEIGDKAGLPAHISHFKASGTKAWGSLHVAGAMIEEARRAGKKVTADQYPYIASSTSLEATLLPDWARAGGQTELKKRLNDPEQVAKIRAEVVKALESIKRIQIASFSARPSWIGKSLEEIASAEAIEVPDVVIQIEKLGGASIVNFGMSEEDVRMAMRYPWLATASDGSAKVLTADIPHPRSFGTFPRKIGYYALEEKILSLEAAIRSATSLPAEIIGIRDRGTLAEGMHADVVVFDTATFRDRATFEEPYHMPTGIEHVLVNGRFAVYDGHATGALAGRPLRLTDEKDKTASR